MRRSEIPQCSGPLPRCDVLLFGSRTGAAQGLDSESIQDWPKDLPTALRQAELEGDRPQGLRRPWAVTTVTCCKRGEEIPMLDTTRRRFITLLGGAAAAWPLAANAQDSSGIRRIGFLGTTTPPAWTSWTGAFVQRLRELGWIEGRTVMIEYRWAESRPERYYEIAAEFARLKVDVIFTAGALSALAARRATSDVPIVFALANNPVSSGLVASLARPRGNVTGLSTQGTDTVGKRLGLMGELVPGLRRWAVMANADFPDAVMELSEMRSAAMPLRLELTVLEIRRADDIAPSFDGLKGRVDAFMSASTRSCSPTGRASTGWRWIRDCRRCMASGNT
jgi:ABC-type uncharacterized transport system substrate-binding protein